MADMKIPEAIRILKDNTMACWWPNGPYPGRKGTNFTDIFGEVQTLLNGIKERQGIPAGEAFFVLDPTNSETALYGKLERAVWAIRRSARIRTAEGRECP